MHKKTIGVAILGAGIIAREEHVPAIQKCSLLSLKAVYSRCKASARELASEAGADAYFEDPVRPGCSLDSLLARRDIEAVIIALPIALQPQFIKRALRAGKHVLSEKPIANDVATAMDLIKFYQELKSGVFWGVAENYRFLSGLLYAAEELRKIGGSVQTFRMSSFLQASEDDKYLSTPWRKNPTHQGGLVLDEGIHLVAGLRTLLSAVGEQIDSVAAFTSQLNPRTPPCDTVHAVLRTDKGASGVFCTSFMTEFKHGFELEVVTENGSVLITPPEVRVTTRNKAGQRITRRASFDFSHCIEIEVELFAEGLWAGNMRDLFSIDEALADLVVLEAMLESRGNMMAIPQLIT